MLIHQRRPVSLCLLSTDLPIVSTLETAATLYQKDSQRFHLLINQSGLDGRYSDDRLLWLEISPYRVILTVQGRDRFAYRHFWEKEARGVSRFWLNADANGEGHALRLSNFTRNIHLTGKDAPEYLRVEYELKSTTLDLGHYVLHLEIHS